MFVWLGGVTFVGSLAFGAYVYLVEWGQAGARSSDWRMAGLNAAAFLGFALHHSLFARARLKAAVARLVPDRLVRSLYVWVASALFVVVLAVWRPVGGTLYALEGAAAILLAIVPVAGLLLIARSVRAIDALELAGIRPSARVPVLQVGGPYRLVRHPLYLGWILVVFGAPQMTADRLLFAVLSSAYLFVAVPWEERSLRAAFGPAYDTYARDVQWRIIPLLY